MNTLIYFLKLLLLLTLLLFTAEEWLNARKQKERKCWLGFLLQVSIFTSPAHWSSLIISCVLLLLWTLMTLDWSPLKIHKFEHLHSCIVNRNGLSNFVYYFLPIILYVISYSLPLVVMYGTMSLFVILQIVEVVLLSLIVCLAIYMALHVKYPLIWCVKRLKGERMSLAEICKCHPMYVHLYIFIMYLPIVMM